MKASGQIDQLRVFIMLRLFTAALLLFLATSVFNVDNYIFYYLIALVSGLSLLYLLWLLYNKYLLFFSWFQVIVDLAIETTLVIYTGAVDSVFAPMYVLSIISAGIFLSPVASIGVAFLSSTFFGAAVFLSASHSMQHYFGISLPDSPERDPLYLFYATYVRVTLFFIVALLTHHLTRMVKRLEERVKVQERLAFLGQIASHIAHEIRNPLAAISGAIENISQDLQDQLAPKHLKLMNAVVEESQRLKRVFSEILDYSKQDEPNLEQVDLGKLMDQIIYIFTQSRDSSLTTTVIKRYKAGQYFVEADEMMLREALSNVVQNAFEATSKDGRLTIEMFKRSGKIAVMITDTGAGMSADVMKSLFIPFKTTKKSGTGLGLAQSHKIITLHQGRIDVKSREGVGTTVQIWLKEYA